ncbi:dinitrogenase iron-molybdenum cofactor N-terminal domain-containing protein [Teredinibacter haidensis]|uniref:dinitrogenase iron-molybdenum cofactor N-terminal domain-containing protein n=1 Tax=Teredinibacter haidensis TaxID=2731755 RepID=UPI000948FBE4|nr:dinitrogenase iron-molybdenum cofactor N-terminal domain-containing protein [Teredinibacter haidensis]
MSTQINRETALRIALAARALPGTNVGELLEIVQKKVKGELNGQTLLKITVGDLAKGLSEGGAERGSDGTGLGLPEIKEAVRILWGERELDSLPKVKPLQDIPARSVRVAICSNTGERLDGHFGSCIRFLIYQVSDSEHQLIDIRSTVEADLSEDRNAFRANLIGDCQILYVVSIGGPAAAKVIKAGVYPIKRVVGGEAKDVLLQLQGVMAKSPPPWLAKFIGDKPEDRIRFMREDRVAGM